MMTEEEEELCNPELRVLVLCLYYDIISHNQPNNTSDSFSSFKEHVYHMYKLVTELRIIIAMFDNHISVQKEGVLFI